jgi:haloacetate dehalogenase
VASHGRAPRLSRLALDVPCAAGAVSGDHDRKGPAYYFDTRAAAGTKAKSLSAFDPRSLAHYHAFFNDPVRIHATCEDYRAGRTTDLAHDEASRNKGDKIGCPLLAIWGAAGGIPAETNDPLATWREWASDVRGFALDSGHYLAEEVPEATAQALIAFFTAS